MGKMTEMFDRQKTKDDEPEEDIAVIKARIRDNIIGTIGWSALLLGAIALSWNFTPVEMADYLRGIWRDVVDIVTRMTA